MFKTQRNAGFLSYNDLSCRSFSSLGKPGVNQPQIRWIRCYNEKAAGVWVPMSKMNILWPRAVRVRVKNDGDT